MMKWRGLAVSGGNMIVHVVNRVLFALHEGTMHWCVTVPAFNITDRKSVV